MGEITKIQWTDHTFNPWRGCTKVSTGCTNCYAEALSKRNPKILGEWGPNGTRIPASEAKWKEPLKWNRAAAQENKQHKIFCASLADIFEDRPELVPWRERLWQLIQITPHLTWQILTKRPENINRMLPSFELANIWLGTSIENQETANARIYHLMKAEADTRFLSIEPLLARIDLISDDCFTSRHIQWIIIGGESGPKARECKIEWIESLAEQCFEAAIPYFIKQLGSKPTLKDQPIKLKDKKGGDPSEWPEHLRIRKFPEKD